MIEPFNAGTPWARALNDVLAVANEVNVMDQRARNGGHRVFAVGVIARPMLPGSECHDIWTRLIFEPELRELLSQVDMPLPEPADNTILVMYIRQDVDGEIMLLTIPQFLSRIHRARVANANSN